MLEINSKAPDFTLPDKDGVMHSLSDYKGKKVILYFYQKDRTAGCTLQAKKFQEAKNEFSNNNTVVIGISKDSIKLHQKFISENNLEFLLLSDEESKVISMYESWGQKYLYGRPYMGTFRNTYVIDEEGIIIKTFEKVKPDMDVLKYLA